MAAPPPNATPGLSLPPAPDRPRPRALTSNEHAAEVLLTLDEELATAAAERWLAGWDELGPEETQRLRVQLVADGREHLAQLASAVLTDRAVLFADYLEWRASRYGVLDLSPADEHAYLEVLGGTIAHRLPAALVPPAADVLERGLRRLRHPGSSPASFLTTDGELAHIAARYLDALLAGEQPEALALVRRAVAQGTSPRQLYLEVFQPVLREVGRLWQLGRATVSQEHEVTQATQRAMAEVAARHDLGRTPDAPRVVVACVGGEQHELGARMVHDLFELEGWQTHFLGADCPPVDLADLAVRRGADLVAVSATRSVHLDRVRGVVTAVRERSDVPILVGGRPFNLVDDLWRQVGADGTAPDAERAVEVATLLVARAA